MTNQEIQLTVKNYRCFPEQSPARLTLRRGFTSLIGINNAGKSTLLRMFYELRPVIQQAIDNLHQVLVTSTGFNLPPEITDRNEVFSKLSSGGIELTIEPTGFGAATEPAHEVTGIVLYVARTGGMRAELRHGDELIQFDGSGISMGPDVIVQGDRRADVGPIWRALRSLSRTLYIGPFRNAVNVGAQERYYDLQIGQAFIHQWRELQTGNDRATNEATERLTQSIREVFGFETFAIIPTPGDQTLALFINGESRRLGEVGAGLAQFIVCLANVAVHRPDWILIDEPEMNLHPALQGRFLRALASFAGMGVVFATHSLGLARSESQAIYSLQQVRLGEAAMTPYAATPRLAEFLGELGYAAMHEIGFDRLLLVEGPNDVLAVKEILRWYGKEHSTVVLPLGGGQMIKRVAPAELLEVLQITPHVAALIDSERGAPGDELDVGRAAFVEACRQVGVTCHVLERRAIENYLTEEAIKKVKGDKYRPLEPFEKLNSLEFGWAKAENWRIAAAMQPHDLEGTDLATFLESL